MNTFSFLRHRATLLSLLTLLGVSHAAVAQTFAYDSTFGSVGSGNGQFSGPVGIAVDSNGNLYVADTSINVSVKYYTPSVSLTEGV